MSKSLLFKKFATLCAEEKETLVLNAPPLPVPQNVTLEFNHLSRPSVTFFHQKFVLKIHLSGSSRGYVEKKLYDFLPGEGILIFPFQLHRVTAIDPDSGQRRFIVNFTLSQEDQKLLEPLRNKIFRIGEEEAGLLNRMIVALKSGRPAAEEETLLALTLLLAKLRAEVPQAPRPPPERPSEKNVFDFLYDHYKEGLKVKEIALKLGYSEAGLRVKFHRETGRTIGAFLQELRLRDAAQQLQNTRLPIQEIGVRCGFSNAFVFSRAFRKYFGVPPKTFRENR